MLPIAVAGELARLATVSVTPSDLTGTERAVLLILMAESRPVPNPDLLALGPKLDKPARDRLNDLGLIESERTGGRFVHELTDRGWHLCREILSAGAPPRSSGPAKTLYTVLGAVERYLNHADLSLADVFGYPPDVQTAVPTENLIRNAYAKLTTRPGGWVGLAHLRSELTDASRPDVDAALHTLYRAPGVSLIREENQKALTSVDHDAAIMIGGQNKHLIAIER